MLTNITLLLFIGAGFFSSACHELEEIIGSKEIIIWELNCCDPSGDNGWTIAGKLFGWRNKATIASTIGYFSYWIIIIIYVLFIYSKDPNNSTIQQDQQQQQQISSLLSPHPSQLQLDNNNDSNLSPQSQLNNNNELNV